jgi:hypothetical protein
MSTITMPGIIGVGSSYGSAREAAHAPDLRQVDPAVVLLVRIEIAVVVNPTPFRSNGSISGCRVSV